MAAAPSPAQRRRSLRAQRPVGWKDEADGYASRSHADLSGEWRDERQPVDAAALDGNCKRAGVLSVCGIHARVKDLVNTGEIVQTSYRITSLPAGQIVYARLWTKLAGVWRYTHTKFSVGR